LHGVRISQERRSRRAIAFGEHSRYGSRQPLMRPRLGYVVASLSLLAPLLPSSTDMIFREAPAKETGIRWVHISGKSDHRYLPETIPPGVAIFDYNNDGRMDILLINTGESVFFHPPRPGPQTALYRNNGDRTFTDVTAMSGLNPSFFGMGVGVGDYDGDGHDNVFLTGYGKCFLYHNNGDGTFTDVTRASGIEPPGWSTSAVWFDYNNDGRLDLFVAQFVDYSSLKICSSTNAYGGQVENAPEDESHYCFPKIFDPAPSHLYRNDGGGRFTDVSRETGILDSPGKGFGVVATDINNDGYLDVFQANDTVANFLFVNRGGKKFEEIGLASGVGYSEDGQTRSGMGVDAADFDGDGRQDLFVANVDQQTFSIYKNNGDETFLDFGRQCGIAGPTRLLSGWGLKFFDYDNDGRVDLILANGHPDDLVDRRMKGVTYREPLLLFHNEDGKSMSNVSATTGPAFQDMYAARGLAVGDLNNDGYPDLVVGINGGPPLVLYNTARAENRWIGLTLKPVKSAPGAAGTLIQWSAAGVVRSRLVTAGGSYMSSHDPRQLLGLGKAARADWIEVHWPAPSKQVDRVSNVASGKYFVMEEGKGFR
jgi:hypothetical protein